jgi:hypothetical protein
MQEDNLCDDNYGAQDQQILCDCRQRIPDLIVAVPSNSTIRHKFVI